MSSAALAQIVAIALELIRMGMKDDAFPILDTVVKAQDENRQLTDADWDTITQAANAADMAADAEAARIEADQEKL